MFFCLSHLEASFLHRWDIEGKYQQDRNQETYLGQRCGFGRQQHKDDFKSIGQKELIEGNKIARLQKRLRTQTQGTTNLRLSVEGHRERVAGDGPGGPADLVPMTEEHQDEHTCPPTLLPTKCNVCFHFFPTTVYNIFPNTQNLPKHSCKWELFSCKDQLICMKWIILVSELYPPKMLELYKAV